MDIFVAVDDECAPLLRRSTFSEVFGYLQHLKTIFLEFDDLATSLKYSVRISGLPLWKFFSQLIQGNVLKQRVTFT